MLGENRIKQIIEKVLAASKADQTEAIISSSDNSLTRFACNEIHQNMAWKNQALSVRVITDKKIGVVGTNDLSDKSIQQTVEKAIEIASFQRPDPEFISLPSSRKITNVKNEIIYASEKDLAYGANQVITSAKRNKLVASGAYASEVSELGVGNSMGVMAYHVGSSCNLSTIVLGGDSSGFAQDVAKKTGDIDASKVGEVASLKAVESRGPTDITPGTYEVIFEPQAVAEMMSFFQWYAPNSRIYYEGASPLSGKLGEKVCGENITIVDDPLHPDVFPMPFDFEGQPKKKLTIIDRGILKNIVYDSYYASRYKAKNTGHALPAPNTMGPIPLHLYISPGKLTLNEMISNVKKGLLVTRLWYVRVLNAKALNITGMTRDGTFLIENGKIVRPVRNLRFNQSIPEALNNVLSIENKLTRLSSFEGEMVNLMPSLHIGKWNFTSGTLF